MDTLITYSRLHCGLRAVSAPVLRLGTDISPSSWKSWKPRREMPARPWARQARTGPWGSDTPKGETT